MKLVFSLSRLRTFQPVIAGVCLLALVLLFGAGDIFASSERPSNNPQSQSRRDARKAKPTKRAKERAKGAKEGRRDEPAEYSADDGEDVDGRQSWFMSQRTYPFASIPVEARRLAWASRPPPATRGKFLGIESVLAQTWTPIGPMPTRSYAPLFANFGLNSGRINAIAVSPGDPQLILVGASSGGIWRSADGGATFVPVSDSQVDLAVGSIAFAPSNPSIVYAGMGDMHDCCDYMGSGVLKSTDAGQTWTKVSGIGLPLQTTVGKIEVDPVFSNRVYLALYRSLDTSQAGSFPFGGIYLSTDGGNNWTKTLAGVPRDLVISPSNPQVIFAAMRGIGTSGTGGLGGLYRSNDGGLSWNSSPVYASVYPAAFGPSGGLRDIRVAVSPANPQRVYVYSGNGSSSIRLAVSNDGGSTFPVDNLLTTVDSGQFGYNTFLCASPFDANTVYIGARDVYKSADGGTSWTNLTKNFDSAFVFLPSQSTAHPDQHSMAFSNADPNNFFIGNDGGIYKTTDGGTSFQSLNATLSLTQFISIARHPVDPTISYGGSQDNGTQRRQAASSQWEDFASGDGGRVVINPLDPSTVFTTYIYGRIRRWINNGSTNNLNTSNSTFGEPVVNPRIAFYPPFTGNGVDAKLYFGTWKLFVSSDLGVTWTTPGGATDLTTGGTDVLSAIGVSRSNSNVIYTGSANGRVMVSSDGGQNWTAAGSGLPNRFIASINVDYANSAVAYLTVSGFGSGHVFKTTDTGASWTNVSGTGSSGLPNIPTSALLIDPNDPNVLYAGTDVGVFRSTTGGGIWTTFNDGMPPVVVTAFTTNSGGQIQVATYGRGAYEAVSAAPTFSISGRVADGFGNGIGGATVTLSGSSSGATVADSSGNYTFAGLPSGSYNLSPSKAGQYTGFTRTLGSLSSNSVGFDLRLDPFVTVSVHTSNSSGDNLSAVAISTTGQLGAPLTNSLGNLSLSFTVPAAGGIQITLTPAKLGYAFNPSSFTFGSQAGNQVVSFNAIPPNPMDDPGSFVAQQYRDFLAREPDQGGLAYWTSQITGCGSDALCLHNRRIDVSAAFFVELEFQKTGSFVYRLFKGGLGRRPTFSEFTTDRAQVMDGPTLEQTKQSLALAFVQRTEFATKYAGKTDANSFADSLIFNIQQNSSVDLTSQKPAIVASYTNGTNQTQSRAMALRTAIDNTTFTNVEYNPSFVLMQYFGYLGRDPEQGGYLFWLNVLNNQQQGNYRGMICAFITSAEYQHRFGTSVTRTDRDCGQ